MRDQPVTRALTGAQRGDSSPQEATRVARHGAQLYTLALTLVIFGAHPLQAAPMVPPSGGWFTLSVDGSPPRYLSSLSALSPWLKRGASGCVTELREGEALIITTHSAASDPHASARHQRGCSVRRAHMDPRALLAFGLKLDLNHESAEGLQRLKGVGPRLAQRIIQGRPWARLKSLIRLRGVGSKTLKRLSQQLRVEPARLLWSVEGLQ